MFTPEECGALRARLVARAHEDDRIVGAALTGSAARGEEDRWSDVDMFLAIAASARRDQMMAEGTRWMRDEEGAVHHWDFHSGEATYRVFLIETGLQVDIAFTPESSLAARRPTARARRTHEGSTGCRLTSRPRLRRRSSRGSSRQICDARSVKRGAVSSTKSSTPI